MKLVKSLLLGSAAGICAVAGAQAADLPYRKAEAVEYVRVCSAYGAGFFFIPGTDTCIRVGGRVRFEYDYLSGRSRTSGLQAGSPSGYIGLGQLNLDSRTQTSYGTLRAFVRFILAGRTGGYITSGTAQRFAQAYPALGQDTFGLSQQFTNVDKAFIQFAGITAGRASSFFDFYAHDVELVGGTAVSDTGSTNLFAYTATLGNGFSATLSAEDPTQRRQPVFASGAGFNSAATGPNFTTLTTTFNSTVPLSLNGAGQYGPYTGGVPAGYYTLDVQQKNEVPDFVAALRWDQTWGSLQVMGASHQLTVGKINGAFTAAGAAIPTSGTGGVIATQPSDEYGWAVGAGAKINLPMIAAGDVLWIQAAYAQGALSYTGFSRFAGYEAQNQNYSGRFAVQMNDAVVDAFGKMKLSESASVTAAFLHYWTPQWRSALFGSYSGINFSNSTRAGAGPFSTVATTTAQANTLAFSPLFKDFTQSYVGANLIWSPVRDLDIGVEAVYTRIDVDGRVADANKGISTPATGIPLKTVSYDDVFMTRFRVQRDF